MTERIKFGTDGWRARIARDFTFDNVSLVARSAAEVMRERVPGKTKMIVGYDRRFLSKRFAELCAAVYAEEGYEVLLPETFVPTPAISWCAKHEPGAAGATVITASHNPPEWNGFKFKETFGGSALPATTAEFEERLGGLAKRHRTPAEGAFGKFVKEGKIRHFDPRPKYFEAVLRQVNPSAIRSRNLSIGLDVMFGAAADHYADLLSSVGVKARVLHSEENPGFGGTPPEPIAKHLPELCALVREKGYICGLATDGDADRLGAVDEEGNYFTTQQILSVAYWHMLKNREKSWNIARSVSTTKMVDLVAERAGVKSLETPVGFKFIAEKMLAGEAQIGGEESGGIGIVDHIPERDGLLTGLLLLEILAATGKGLKAIYEDLCREERPYYFKRHDIALTGEQAASALRRLEEEPPAAWDGRPVESVLRIDGHKFYLRDGAWVLIRASGTEPIFRLYSEAESLQAADRLVAAARAFVEQA